MAQLSTKHPKREQTFDVNSYVDGLNQDLSAQFLPITALTQCMNMKYVSVNGNDGNVKIVLKVRQGTERISNTAIGSAVKACTYYIYGNQYIIATASKLYYLDSGFDPVEIGAIEGIPTFTEFHQKLIIHDGGKTKAWNGTAFEKLNKYIVDELLGTGNNSDVKYSDTLEHYPVEPSTLTISYTDTTAKTITDDGNGRLSGDISSGVVKTITGASRANPCELTVASHGFSTGDSINIQSVAGMTELNNRTFTVTSTGGNTFTLDGEDSIAYSEYSSGGTASANAINYTTGDYTFTCSGAPDNTETITATYEQHEGAPKSKAGLVRASRLYLWGDPDYPSRLSYSGANDEDGWDSSSSGGYLDVDKDDGYSLIGCLDFFDSLVLMKESGTHRLDNFPGDTTFRVVPLIAVLGCKAYRACSTGGNILSFVSDDGWSAIAPSDQYGDIQKIEMLSKSFSNIAKKYANSSAISEYNQQDNQLWLNLHNGTDYFNYIHVLNLSTGGQLSHYKFQFGHSCFKYVNGVMLIGGSDGHLYKLLKTDTRFKDNGTSYSSNTYFQGTMTNWGLVKNRKHNKYINVLFDGGMGATATLTLYTDNNYSDYVYTTSLIVPMGNVLAYDTNDVLAHDADAAAFGGRMTTIKKKFNYHELMYRISGISGAYGVQVSGIDFTGAILGE